MKICIVHVNCESLSKDYAALIDANFAKAKRPDTEIVHKYVGRLRRATDTVFALPILLNKVDVVRCMIEAAEQGVDGIMVACSGDPGVGEGRTLVDIPVIGPMEAALHLAAGYGKKIGIVTVPDPSWKEYCETIAENCGLASRLAGVESITIPTAEAFTSGWDDTGPVRDAMIAAGTKLIERGANTIVLGSAGLSTMASSVGLVEITGVPVFDALTAGLKMTELRVDIHRQLGLPSASRIGMFERFDASNRDRVARLFGITWEGQAVPAAR